MKKGTIVRVKCHHCGTSLVNDEETVAGSPSIHFKAIEEGTSGEKKDIFLSAKFGDFRKIGHKFPKGTVVQFFCPHCGEELKPNHIPCSACNKELIILPAENGTMHMLGICPTVGCHHHKTNPEIPTEVVTSP